MNYNVPRESADFINFFKIFLRFWVIRLIPITGTGSDRLFDDETITFRETT
jgi:hypothetical protein